MQAVSEWLAEHDISDFVHTDNKLWLAFNGSAALAEDLIPTEFYERDAGGSGGRVVKTEAFCEAYHLPPSISKHVDFALPGVHGSDITDRIEKGKRVFKRESRFCRCE